MADSVGLNSLGDQPIHQGRLYIVEGRLEVRPCDKAGIFLLVSGFPIEDALYEYASTRAAADAPVYVRFNGQELMCEGNVPDRYTGVVEVNRVQSREPTVPPSCT